MIPIRCALAGALLLSGGVARAATPAEAIVGAFRTICAVDDPTPAETLALADRLGWRRSGPDAPPDFNPATQRLAPAGSATLVLTTGREATTTQSVDSCGVSAPLPVSGLAEATQAWLGGAPIFAMGHSATFSEVRIDGVLRPAVGVAQADIRAAHDAGRLYSLMVLDDETAQTGKGRATLALLRVEPKR